MTTLDIDKLEKDAQRDHPTHRRVALALFATDARVVKYLERNGEKIPVDLPTFEKAWKRGLDGKKPESPWVDEAFARAIKMVELLNTIETTKQKKQKEKNEALRAREAPAITHRRDRFGNVLEVGDKVAVLLKNRVTGTLAFFLQTGGCAVDIGSPQQVLAKMSEVELLEQGDWKKGGG